MSQINFRLEDQAEKIITFLAKYRSTTKATIAKEFLNVGIKQSLFPLLAQMYQEGKISVKKISVLTSMSPIEVIEMLPKYIEKSPMTDEIADYTSGITTNIIEELMKKDE
jgi:hypothetical protein